MKGVVWHDLERWRFSLLAPTTEPDNNVELVAQPYLGALYHGSDELQLWPQVFERQSCLLMNRLRAQFMLRLNEISCHLAIPPN